jgi:hypothetical protein
LREANRLRQGFGDQGGVPRPAVLAVGAQQVFALRAILCYCPDNNTIVGPSGLRMSAGWTGQVVDQQDAAESEGGE